MALQLIIDNTDYHNWLGNLMRAIYRPLTMPMSQDMKDLILSINADEVELHLRRALALGIA